MKCVPDITYDPAKELALDLYLPDDLNATACVIYAHGGGFRRGARHHVEAPHFAQHLTDAGFAVASISYRLRTNLNVFEPRDREYIEAYVARSAKVGLTLSPRLCGPEFIAAMEDMSRAIEYLWVEGKGLGIQGRKIGVLGVSAGGIAGLALAYPPTHWAHRVSKPDAVVAIGSALVQPWRLDAEGPPCLMIHGQRDRIIDISNPKIAAQRAETAGAPVTLLDTGVKGHSTQVDVVLDGDTPEGVPYMQLVLDHFARLVDG